MPSSKYSRGSLSRRMFLPVTLALAGFLSLTSSAPAALVQTDSWGSSWSRSNFHPSGLDFSKSGEAVIGDAGFARVARLDTAGDLDATWHTGSPSPGYPYLLNPAGVAVDPDGNVFALDRKLTQVSRFSPDGTLIDTWALADGTSGAYGIEYDDSGTLFLLRDESVQRYSLDGELEDSWGGFKSDFSDPVFTTDDNGEVLVAGTEVTGEESGVKSVYRFGLDGALLSKSSTSTRVSFQYLYIKCGSGIGPINGLDGYMGIAAREGGGAWVVPMYGDHLIQGLTPDGTVDAEIGSGVKPEGDLEVGPDGHFWIASDGIYIVGTNEDYAAVSEYDADGTLIRKLVGRDFPKYFDDDRGEGRFSGIEDLSVTPSGGVDTYEDFNARTQRFSDSGSFQWLADGPFIRYVIGFPIGMHQLFSGPGESARLLDSAWKRVYTYSDTGVQTSVVDLDVPGLGAYGATDAGGGNMWVASDVPLKMNLVDSSGHTMNSFALPLVQDPQGPNGSVVVRRTPTGDLLILSGQAVRQFTTSGSYVRGWGVVPATEPPSYASDLAVGPDGRVHVLISSSNSAFVRTYTSGGQLIGDQTVAASGQNNPATQMAVSPSGDFYLGDRTSVRRYDEVPGASVGASGSAATVRAHSSGTHVSELVCDACDCYDTDPDSDLFLLKKVSFDKARRSARLQVWVPEVGRLRLDGGNRLVEKSITVAGPGLVSVQVALRRPYNRPVHRKSKVYLRVLAKLYYTPYRTGAAPDRVFKVLNLKRKFTARRR